MWMPPASHGWDHGENTLLDGRQRPIRDVLHRGASHIQCLLPQHVASVHVCKIAISYLRNRPSVARPAL